MDSAGTAWPGFRELRATYGIGQKRLRDDTAEMVAAGLLELGHRKASQANRAGATVYRAHLDTCHDILSARLKAYADPRTDNTSARASGRTLTSDGAEPNDAQRALSDPSAYASGRTEHRNTTSTEGGEVVVGDGPPTPEAPGDASPPSLTVDDIHRAAAWVAALAEVLPRSVAKPAVTDRLAAELLRLRELGWDLELVAERVSASGWTKVDSPAGVVLARLRRLEEPDIAARVAAAERYLNQRTGKRPRFVASLVQAGIIRPMDTDAIEAELEALDAQFLPKAVEACLERLLRGGATGGWRSWLEAELPAANAAEQKRQEAAERRRQAEEARKAEEAAERKRQADEAAAERKRQAEEAAAERKRQAEEAAAEQKRQAAAESEAVEAALEALYLPAVGTCIEGWLVNRRKVQCAEHPFPLRAVTLCTDDNHEVLVVDSPAEQESGDGPAGRIIDRLGRLDRDRRDRLDRLGLEFPLSGRLGSVWVRLTFERDGWTATATEGRPPPPPPCSRPRSVDDLARFFSVDDLT